MASNETSLTRRSFLKATAMTAGAAAVVGTAGCTTIAEQSEEEAVQAAEEKTYTNWCRGNCGGPCALTGTVREGKLVKTSPTVLPAEARLVQTGCVRGHAGPQRVYGTNRVLYPMKQTGERGSDNWERISWDEACAITAEKFKAATDEFGPKSVVVSFGCGNATGVLNGFYARYGKNVAYNNHGFGPEMFLRRTGYTETFYSSDAIGFWMVQMVLHQPSNSVEDMPNSKVIICFGTNPAESATRAWPHICKARENGTKLITVDPMFSKTAAASDIWVPVRPGTDGALALAMCNYVIENDLIDYDYLRNGSVAPLLVKEDGSYLRLSDLGLDPVDVPDAKGESVPTDTEVVYDEASGTFGSSHEVKDPAILGEFEANGIKVQPVYNMVSQHIKQYTAEFAAEECGIPVELVNQVCEIYAKERPGKILTFNGFAHATNSYLNYFDIGLLVSLTGNVGIKGGGYGQLGMLLEGSSYMVGAKTIDRSANQKVKDAQYNFGFTTELLPQVVETGTWKGEDYPVKCLLISHQNLLGSQMGPTYMKKAFEKLDFIAVADSYMTYTAKYADVIFPISLSWEAEDFDGNFMMQKAVEPMGECKSSFEMFKSLAEALGYDDLYEKSGEEYLREALDTPENLEAGLGYDAYKEKGAIYGEYKYGELVLPETNATGRTMFYVEELIPNNEYGQTFELHQRMPHYEPASEAYKDNPLREKYPLFGVGHYHDIYFGQTFTGNIPWLDELRGEPFMLIHPTAADERGIGTGDTVKIYNDHGYVVCKAVVSTGVREDVIIAPHGYAHEQYIEGDPQDLVGLAIDPVACNNNYNDWLCEVEKM